MLKAKIVFTNGCFDLFHPGHVELLRFAKAQGEWLVVALNTDHSVRGIKGHGRPLMPFAARRTILRAIRYVDQVISLADPTPIALIEEIRPSVLVKGGDYKPREIVGAELVLSYGGKVLLGPYYQEWSSTKIAERFIEMSLNGRG